ncbi:histamine H3 receptor-like [Protopterus annectens]|uniref:histamine H3 receptor-like n=1 Tax=Protopterus annectens TaxID=7888 RepID=UPI001CFBE199|nr:histamine H3 receptor-like [Protopterus annectens]
MAEIINQTHRNESQTCENESPTEFPNKIFFCAFMAMVVLVTILGNVLVILAFVVDKSLRTHNNYFFLNLAICDFLVGAVSIPLYIPYALGTEWPFGEIICKFWLVLDHMLCSASVFNIVLISYDRFLCVTRAVAYRAEQGSLNNAFVKIVAVWIFAFLIYGPAILVWELVNGKVEWTKKCNADFLAWWFLLIASTFEFFIPFISVTYFNMSICLNIKKRSRSRWNSISDGMISPTLCEERKGSAIFFRRKSKDEAKKPVQPVSVFIENEFSSASQSSPYSTRRNRLGILHCMEVNPVVNTKRYDTISRNSSQRIRLLRDKKVAKSLAVIVCIFGLCWAPYSLYMILACGIDRCCTHFIWYDVTFWLQWLNSSVNPFLYPLCHLSFRNAFLKILCPHQSHLRRGST